MAPKRAPCEGFPIVTDAVVRSVEAARAARAARGTAASSSAPHPVISSTTSVASGDGGRAAASRAGAGQGTAALTSRTDFAPVRNTRRGGVDTALWHADQAGMDTLVQDLIIDREAASGRGGQQVLLLEAVS